MNQDTPIDEVACLLNTDPKCPHCGEDLGDAWEPEQLTHRILMCHL
jgi:hypothetical protein